jgi:glycosyltransferase involved in cell wall biosynthesis
VRVLVVTDDRLGPAMAGSALRAWEIARALAASGFEVRIAAARGSTAPAPGPPLDDRPRWRWAEVVVAPPWSLPPRAFLGRHCLVVDGATPLLAELASLPDSAEVVRRRRTAAARLPLVLSRCDALLVAGAAQRRWWSGRLGPRRPDLPILDLPFGIPAEPPTGEPQDIEGVPRHHAVVLWWGGVWPWLDLDTLLAARARLGAAPVSVVVPVAARPGGAAARFGPSELHEAAARHGLRSPRVVGLSEWVAYDRRDRVLRRAAAMAVLHRAGDESDLSFRTRAMDGVWAGVPLLLSEGGEVADLARRHGWGAVAPVGDIRAVAAAMELLLGEREQDVCRRALVASRASWTWERLCRDLVDLLPRLTTAGRSPVLPAALRSGLVAAGLRRSA